ncbi:hypothetical protein U0070_013863 [Myodes glareolus]|uniref:Uncharacterized protein n=1 Tax=Myodes glareolus TaxID=447135 RepID=A0AAW0H7B9_MYOGA
MSMACQFLGIQSEKCYSPLFHGLPSQGKISTGKSGQEQSQSVRLDSGQPQDWSQRHYRSWPFSRRRCWEQRSYARRNWLLVLSSTPMCSSEKARDHGGLAESDVAPLRVFQMLKAISQRRSGEVLHNGSVYRKILLRRRPTEPPLGVCRFMMA